MLGIGGTEGAGGDEGLGGPAGGQLLLDGLLFGDFFDVEEGLDELLRHWLVLDLLLEPEPADYPMLTSRKRSWTAHSPHPVGDSPADFGARRRAAGGSQLSKVIGT